MIYIIQHIEKNAQNTIHRIQCLERSAQNTIYRKPHNTKTKVKKYSALDKMN